MIWVSSCEGISHDEDEHDDDDDDNVLVEIYKLGYHGYHCQHAQ